MNTPNKELRKLLKDLGKRACERKSRGRNGAFHYELTRRMRLTAHIAKKRSDDGFVWLAESGRDCDCVEYVDSPDKIVANRYVVDREINKRHEYADGPMSIGVLSREEAKRVTPHSRDLALEAFEDGHPHVVSSARFDEEGAY